MKSCLVEIEVVVVHECDCVNVCDRRRCRRRCLVVVVVSRGRCRRIVLVIVIVRDRCVLLVPAVEPVVVDLA